MELSGRLSSFPIAELLHWAHNDSRDGSLTVRSAGREKRIFFREGRIVTCLTDEPSEYYGQFLLLADYLDQETLFECLSECREQQKRLGSVLEERGILSLEQVKRTLRFHLEDVICDIFLWDHGVFFFRAETPPAIELLAEPISPVRLTLEGSHWVDQVARIRQDLPDDYVVLGRVEGARVPEDLTPRQRCILEEVDSLRRLEALWGAIHGSYFRFLVAAHELLTRGLVRVIPRVGPLHRHRRDVGLDDLLFEQATREHALTRQRLGEAGSFERFVPIWIRPPSSEEWDRMPSGARAFFRSFDGIRRVGDLLSNDETDWVRELELLMLQIGKEAVALLPAPVSEFDAEASEPRSKAVVGWERESLSLPFHRRA